MLKVIDVYHGNPTTTVNAAILASDGVVVKASEAGSTDPAHDATVAYARTAHRVVGHYHFGWLGRDAATQAAYFLAAAKPAVGDTLWLDMEAESGAGGDQWGPSWPARATWVLSFVGAVKAATGARCGLYCNKSDWALLVAAATPAQQAALDAVPLWIAAPSDPAGKPAIRGPWVMHQYGVLGGLDRDVFAGDVAAWHALGVPAMRTAPGVVVPISAHQAHVIAERNRLGRLKASAAAHLAHLAHLAHIRRGK